ncbi:helix-turn-helix domain-containing protein [Treponema pedis]|uniref:HTH cro/C1-type domain-containing protein n=2 Tax=Treponema pedis TaxID=409322 RepID=S6A8A2_9SPIR|nr:helix-turn-helix domain-containing protein [Treponema pedis]AGT43474.1 hypothetical protein TPE_0978 [Treponema pedis str. T A4]QOW61009.1 helix-turn-helix domain-containing protein [Treponema pedis]
MNEIGKLLIETRMQHGLELEQVARETNIAKRYLEALENDDYSVFPAEPYILGFLRNYCEYLGLNPEEFIKLYKQIKIQETDLPPDALLPKKNAGSYRLMIIALAAAAVIALIAGLAYFIFSKWLPDLQERQAKNITEEKIIESRKAGSYELTEPRFEKRLFIGDSLKIQAGGKDYVLTVEKVSPSLVLNTEAGNQIINLAETLKLDLNGDAVHDAEILVEDIDKNNPEAGSLVLIKTGSELAAEATVKASDVIVSESSGFSSNAATRVLFEGGSAYPVTLNATFRGYCLFRHESDKANREERYYQKAEQLTVQANNGFRIWASNGNAVKMQLVAGGKTVDLEISRPGEVIVKDLKWIKDDTTRRFKFIIADVD